MALVRGISAAEIARRFHTKRYPLSRHTIWRHKTSHMPVELKAALLAGEGKRLTPEEMADLFTEESEKLLLQVAAQRGHIWAGITDCESKGKWMAAAVMHKSLLSNLTLTGKLLGELATGSQTINNNLIVSPEYLELRHALMEALMKHPEARADVSKILRKVEVDKATQATNPRAIEHQSNRQTITEVEAKKAAE